MFSSLCDAANVFGGTIHGVRRDAGNEASVMLFRLIDWRLTLQQYGNAFGDEVAKTMMHHDEGRSTFTTHYSNGPGQNLPIAAVRLGEITCGGLTNVSCHAIYLKSRSVDNVLG